MKQKLFCLQSLIAVVVCVIMSMTFTSCSDDKDDPADELTSIFVGTWAQDGDDDICIINANGTGYWYDDPSNYKNNRHSARLEWSYKNGWVYLTFYNQMEEISQTEEMRAESVSKNKIVWRRYASYGDDYDAFGEYDLWTWERYTK